MSVSCLAAPSLSAKTHLVDGQFNLPFLTIFLVGVTVTWLVEFFAEARQDRVLRNTE